MSEEGGGGGGDGAVPNYTSALDGRAMPEEKPPGGSRLSDIRQQSRAAGPQPSSRCLKITDGSFLV